MTESHKLKGLSPREAVTDGLYRCIQGLDNNDQALFGSSILKTNTASFTSTNITGSSIDLQGWETINQAMSAVMALVTFHSISNVRVQLSSASTAYLTAHAVAYHIRPDEAFTMEDTSYTAGCLYFIDLVKCDNDDDDDDDDVNGGLWRIHKWDVKVLWSTGDRSIVHPQS